MLVKFDDELICYFNEEGSLLKLSTPNEWRYLSRKIGIKFVKIGRPYISHQINFGAIYVPDDEVLTRTLVGDMYHLGTHLLVEFSQEIWHGYEGAVGRQNLNRGIRKKYKLSDFSTLIKGLYPYRDYEFYLGFAYKYVTETNDQIATLKLKVYNHELKFVVQFYGDLWHGYEGAPGLIHFLYPENEETFETLEQVKSEYTVALSKEFENLF